MNWDISIGIMAYNEEAAIGQLLSAVMSQSFSCGRLKEVFVVASGCTDRTVEITREASLKDPRVKLIEQEQRHGKAAAINLFLSEASGEILILESGDTLPQAGALDKLILPFSDPVIGMTGAHPVPVNPDTDFIGFAVNLMWSLHHEISLVTPKMGELVAFRNVLKAIPKDTAVDEACIEAMIKQKGYSICYVPDALVKNKGPENIRDFIKQRRRIAAGHRHLYSSLSYRVSTQNPFKILALLIKKLFQKNKYFFWTLGTVCLEIIGRGLGYLDFCIMKKNPFIWDIAESTKKLS